MTSQSQLVLGFDYGEKRIGVAVGDLHGLSVRPLTTLAAIKGKPAKEDIKQLIEQYRPECVVVGYPLRGGDEVEKSRRGSQALAMWLGKHFALKVHMCDESYTSSVSPAENRDAHSAMLILRQWLDSGGQR